MMESAWRKAKRALALRLCVLVPAEGDGGATGEPRPASGAGGCRGEAAVTVGSAPEEPVAGGGAFRRSKSGSRSSSKVRPFP